MVIIVALLCLAAIIVSLCCFRIKAVIRLDNLHVHFAATFLVFQITREYVLRCDQKEFLVLFHLRDGKEKKIASLKSVILKKDRDQATDISLVDLIKIITQNRRGRKKSAFTYLNKKSRFDVRIQFALGAGDAYYTALLCGWLIATGNSICAAYTQKRKHFRFYVKPEFNRLLFSLNADCIIAITPANIILGYFIYKNRARGK